MKKRIIFSAIACTLFFAQGVAAAITYDLTPIRGLVLEQGRWKRVWIAANSPCSFDGYYSKGLSEYVCPSSVYLSYGDSIVTGGSTSQLVLKRYAYFWGDNNIGTPSRPLSLDLNGNSFSASGLDLNGHIDNSNDIDLYYSTVSGTINSTKGYIELFDVDAKQDVLAKDDVDIQDSQVLGSVSSSNGGGNIKNSKIKGSVQVKNNLDVVSNSYICGVASSENAQGKNSKSFIIDSYIGNDVSVKKYLSVDNSTVFGTVSTFNRGMNLSEAKILADRIALEFPQNKPTFISSDTTLCGTANSSYSYGGNLVAYCGLNDSSCSAQQSKGKCPADLVSSSEYRDFYDYCGITPPEPEPEPLPEPQVCINEDFTGENPLQNWTVMGRTASTTTPKVVDGRFQVSTNQYEQSTASAYKKTIPSNDNIVQIEFEHYARNSTTNPGGDGIAIVLSDSNIPPSPGATGGALGYGVKPDMEGFAGGWIAFGIDEYGNFSSQGSFEDSQHRPGRKKHSITIRGAGYQKSFDGSPSDDWFGGYKFITNNTNVGSLDEEGGYDSYGNDLEGRKPSDVHRYRMIVDSREDIPGRASGVWVSIERRINNSEWESIIEPFDVMKNFGQPEPPENFMVSITAGTGANTNIHEVAKMKLCADRFNLEPKIDHFRFEYDGSGDVCEAQRVTLSACMNSQCTETYPGNLTNPKELEVTLKDLSNAEWQDSNGESIPSRILKFKDRINLQIRSQGAGSAKLGLEKMSIEAPNIEPIKCKLNGENDFNSACTIVFDSSITVGVPDKVASLPFFDESGNQYSKYSNTPFVSLCESVSSMPETDIVKNIEMRFAYEQPKSGETVSVRFKNSNGEFGESVQLNTTGWTPINNVYFTSSGKASFDLRYPEVGKVSVKARIKDDSESENLSSFVSFPAKLGISVQDSGQCSPDPLERCQEGFVPAGEEFRTQVTAYQYDGKVAENYAEADLILDNSISYPTGGVNAVLLNTRLPEASKWVKGSISFMQSVSEVGEFNFSVKAPKSTDSSDNSTYLGSNAFKIADAVIRVGRFYPGQFSVYENREADMPTLWAYPNEQSFTYMGQPFGLKQFYIEALSKEGGALRNYAYFDDYFAKFNLYESDSKYIGRFSAPSTYSGEWLNSSNKPYVSGQSVGQFSANALLWKKVITQPDGPLNYLEKSSDTSIAIDLSLDSIDKSGVTIGTKELNVQPDIRFGRVDLDDVGGRQSETLHIPLRVEYWNGSRFVVNSNDSQTDINGIKWDQEHIWPTGEGAAPKDVNLADGGEVSSGSSRSVTATQAEAYRQQTRVWLDLEANDLPWLKYNWDKDLAGEENPSSVVTFGIHRGNDRVIYRGEPGLTAQ